MRIHSPADPCGEDEAALRVKNLATDEDRELTEKNSFRTENDQRIKHDFKIKYLSNTVDDISLSSLSSSDKNYLSEDFSDDFIEKTPTELE